MDQITTSDSIIIEENILSDDDEKIRVYGSTRLTSPSKPKSRDDDQSKDAEYGDNRKDGTKATSLLLPSPSVSRKSSSRSADTHVSTRSFADSSSWLQHPKIRENWKVVIGAFLLTLIGSVLFLVGVGIVVSPGRGMHCLVFFIGGLLCLIPGAYHLVYIYLAVKGFEGYSLYDLPVFN
ncbi:transmembrane protein 134-like [Ruditapes philippinarum]|uniref:transmembrane protein 134-like n=1 Tax=Ruditapes philippinarum TaxID=129788 RepID=UPI00295BDB3F|nr:transmembrane protein 134-like [Ruditapes philippinarum]